MKVLEKVDVVRLSANGQLDPKRKTVLGQFFTAAPISMFMASLFEKMEGDVRMLDPGSGPCSLTAAFVDEVLIRGRASSLALTAYEIDEMLALYAQESLTLCKQRSANSGVACIVDFNLCDFVLECNENRKFTHVILNPPYKKILSSSAHRKALREAGVETVNLYAGFVALAIQQLEERGELVAIIPRSFCNGPYYQPFREMVLRETSIKKIHIFDSRSNAFSSDDVLQENVIIHLIKNADQKEVSITSSPIADFHLDDDTGTVTAGDMTTRLVPFESIVHPEDKYKFIHIAANNRDQSIIDAVGVFTRNLDDIGLKVSTGAVVDFRLKDDLRADIEEGAVPLIYPTHLGVSVCWPKASKKPNAIMVSEKSRPWLWRHEGCFVVVRRFSSKEEKRRIVATVYDSSLPGNLIGFDNKLNVFHIGKEGMDRDLAVGLHIYLNCTLLDKYYRLFGGHTQVNATDLRNIHYPDKESLCRMGASVATTVLTQVEIDTLIENEIYLLTGVKENSSLNAQEKIDQALEIIALLGMPRLQQNERSALTLLSLLDLHPHGSWDKISAPMIGVTPIMTWCSTVYGKEYAPNTRETFRRQTLHQFVDGGLALYNPDQPDRPVNSPKACYQIAPELLKTLEHYGTPSWEDFLSQWLGMRETLAAQYAMERNMQMIPLTLDDGTEIHLSPGIHSQLIHDIVTEFGPRFAPGSEVIYLGDTGAKEDFFRKDRLKELGVEVDRKGKLPDVVLYWADRNWLLLIESVTSHGPVDGKRHSELSKLFANSTPGLVYVTAFPDRKIMGKYLSEISWETEVWVTEAPTHMIHFNGDRFLGPH